MKCHNYKILFPFLISLFIFVPKFSFGAEFIASSSAENIHAGDQFEVDILLNTQGENANAVGGTVVYPSNLLQLNEIRDGNSLVNFWIDAPTSTANGVIFSGITPGGYEGSTGKILSLVFTAQAAGAGNISVTNGQLLRNDGSGSEISLTVSDFSFSVSESGNTNGVKVPLVKDNQPPESFVPEVGSDPNVFDGKFFVAFAASDKGSGIDHYEVKETKYRIFDFSKWIVVTSPYVLTDQNLQSYIYVKAVSKTGTERIEEISPVHSLPVYENPDIWFILILVIIFLLLYRKFIWKKHK